MNETTEKLPIDQLAQLDADKSIFFFSVMPLIVIGILAAAGVALYFYRRSKSWNDLGEAMRIDDGDKPLGSAPADSMDSSRSLHSLGPTQPSQRLDGKSDH